MIFTIPLYYLYHLTVSTVFLFNSQIKSAHSEYLTQKFPAQTFLFYILFYLVRFKVFTRFSNFLNPGILIFVYYSNGDKIRSKKREIFLKNLPTAYNSHSFSLKPHITFSCCTEDV